MNDRCTEISLTKAAAAMAGTLGIILLLANVLVSGEDLGFLGLAAIAVAAVLRIRSYCVSIAEMQRNAFELGREAERVSRLHALR